MDWKQYAINRLEEPSTIRGFICLLVLLSGWQLSGDEIDNIVPVFALAVDALLKALLPDSVK